MSLSVWFVAGLAPLLLSAAAPPAPDTVLTISGRVIPAAGAPSAGVRLSARHAPPGDFVETDSAGRFSLVVRMGAPGDSAELVAEAAEHHPALLRLGRDGAAEEQRIVLVPRRWTIPSGSFAGTAVEISPHRASRPVCDGCSSFYPQGGATEAALEHPLLPSWPEEAFPLRVAFDRDNSEQAVTHGDSIAFWEIVGEVEAAFGGPLFRPARYAETLPGDDGPNDVVLVWIVPSLRYAGMGTRSVRAGDVSFAAVWLKGTALLARSDGPALLAHELIHTLGFGHTCSWRSVMAAPQCPTLRASSPTAEDVAYAQLARRVRSLQREHRARWGIGAARDGERALLDAATDPGSATIAPSAR